MASNNPQDYINPIIQSIVASRQQGLQKEQLKQQADEFKQAQALKEAQHAQALKEFDKTSDLHERQLNIQKAISDAQISHTKALTDFNRLQGLGQLNDYIAGGGKPDVFQTQQPLRTPEIQSPLGNVPSVNTPAMVQPPGFDRSVPITSLPNQQDLIAAEANRVRSKAGAQAVGAAEAQEPFKVSADKRKFDEQMAVMGENRGMQQETARMQRDSAERIAAMNNATHIKTAQIAANAHIQAAGMGMVTDPSYLENIVNDVYVTGNQKVTNIPQKLRQGIVASVPQGWTPVDPKDLKLIDETKKMEDVLQIGKDLAQAGNFYKHPLDTTLGIAGYGTVGALKDRLTSVGGSLAETFGKEVGRKSEGDIKRAIDGIYSAKTPAENAQKVVEAEKIFRDILNPVLGKYAPEQATAILSKKGVDPAKYVGSAGTTEEIPNFLKVAPKVSKTGQPLNIPASKKYGKPVYGEE